MKPLIVLVFVFFLASCNRAELVESMVPQDKKAKAIEILETLRKGTGDEMLPILAENLQNPEAAQTIAYIAEGLPDTDYSDLILVDYRWRKVNSKEFYHFVFEYDFSGRYILTDINLEKRDSDLLIAGIHANELPKSVRELSQFTFENKSITHYIIFLAAVIFPLITLYTLIVCIRTKGLKRKWLWCLFTLIGVATFNLNWHNCDFNMQLLSIKLFNSGFLSSGAYGPTFINVSIPLGVILFWRKKMKMKAQQEGVSSGE